MMIENVDWLGHASFRIISGLSIYIDPWKITGDEKADIILITHSHHDHCSPEDVKKLVKESTVIVTVKDAAEKLSGITKNIKIVKPSDRIEVQDIFIAAVPAYNKDKEFHPKSNRWVGFVVEVLGERLYFAGDTDFIQEMKNLKDISIAFLPIGGTYTMNVKEAVEAAALIHPKYVVPMHYGDIVGSSDEADSFSGMMEKTDPTIEVVIKKPEGII